MTLHLIKLCVGCDAIEDLDDWIRDRIRAQKRAGKKPEHSHTTRMTPKRAEELLDGGSLYWVIRGNVQARQRLLDVRPFRDKDGIQRCRLMLEPKTIATDWQPRRAFQGWRYLEVKDAPRDLSTSRAELRAMPPALRRDLADLGLL